MLLDRWSRTPQETLLEDAVIEAIVGIAVQEQMSVSKNKAQELIEEYDLEVDDESDLDDLDYLERIRKALEAAYYHGLVD